MTGAAESESGPAAATPDAASIPQPKPAPDASPDPRVQQGPADDDRAEPDDQGTPEPASVVSPPADEMPTAEVIPPAAEETPAADVVLETYELHPAAPRVWAWSQALLIATPLVPLMIAAGLWQGPRALLANALLGVLVWSIASRHLRLAVARFRCERFARGLRYRHGVWWQSEVFIPSARVQHTEVNQGPIARRYGIGKLKVFTAAVQLGALEIDGLAYADAVLLRDRLLGRESEPRSDAPVAEAPPGDGNG